MNTTSLREKVICADHSLIRFLAKYADESARASFFIIFFWFGILKVLGFSPADTLVMDLLQVTFLGWINPQSFVVGFGVFEVLLGLLVLSPRFERISFLLLGFHLFTTILPLVLLPDHTWSGFLVPTLVGQYILKNAALLALGFVLFARLKPMRETGSFFGEEREDVVKPSL